MTEKQRKRKQEKKRKSSIERGKKRRAKLEREGKEGVEGRVESKEKEGKVQTLPKGERSWYEPSAEVLMGGLFGLMGFLTLFSLIFVLTKTGVGSSSPQGNGITVESPTGLDISKKNGPRLDGAEVKPKVEVAGESKEEKKEDDTKTEEEKTE